MTRAANPSATWRPGMPGGDHLPSGPAGRPATPPGDGHGPQAGPPTVTIGAYPDYPSAQRVVDYLADNRFPVEHTAIVGTNLTLVETVLGRLTTGRAALLGAGTGAWFGLFIGLLFGIFTVGNWLAVILVGLVIGAIWGPCSARWRTPCPAASVTSPRPAHCAPASTRSPWTPHWPTRRDSRSAGCT